MKLIQRLRGGKSECSWPLDILSTTLDSATCSNLEYSALLLMHEPENNDNSSLFWTLTYFNSLSFSMLKESSFMLILSFTLYNMRITHTLLICSRLLYTLVLTSLVFQENWHLFLLEFVLFWFKANAASLPNWILFANGVINCSYIFHTSFV